MKIGAFQTEYKKAKVKIERYVVGVFNVDIVDDGETYEAWLSHSGYGVSSLMFGVSKSDMVNGKEQFLSMVDNNICDYISAYHDEYMLDVLHDKDNVKYRGVKQ